MDASLIAKKRPVATLTRQNWRDWFHLLKLYLAGEGLSTVITQTLEQYAGMTRITEELNDLGIKETVTKFILDDDRRTSYQVGCAKVQYLLSICVDSLDNDYIRTFTTAHDQWHALWNKYNKTRPHENREDLQKISTFTLGPDTRIEDGWTQIKELRRRIVQANPTIASAFAEPQLFNFLLAGLPESFSVTVDTLNAQPLLSIEEKLTVLVQNEDSHKGKDAAHFTKDKRPRSGSDTKNSGCFLCAGKHFMMKCPFLEFAKGKVQRELARRSRSHHDSRDHGSNREKSSHHDKHGRFKRSHRDRQASAKESKGYRAEVVTDSSSSESSSSDDEPLNTKKSSAALNDSNEEETAAISSSAICKIPPSSWVSDTAATSYMTDDLNLFRGSLVKIPRRRIRVGGGSLWSNQKGTAVMKVAGGNSALLRDVLYVPKLGVNLLSGRRACSNNRIQGSFDDKSMVFEQDGKVVIRADVVDGVYLVNYIAKGLEETALAASTNPAHSDKDKITARYNLWHRRFSHIGSAKLSKLHRVTTLAEKIIIPADSKPCEVCKLTKMRNRIPKTLSPWKDSVLDLVSLDVCGPLPPTLRGNQYFCQIIDNASHYTWTLVGKNRKDIVTQLHKWKSVAETQSGQKLLAVRIDNAAELKEAIQTWATTEGVKRELTTAHSSHQNGIAERSIQTAENGARAMLKDAKLPLEFWDDAIEADTYLRNRTNCGPSIDGDRYSPYEALTGHKPSIDHVRVFGCKCYSYVHPKSQPRDTRHDKLVDRGRVGIFMGYSEDTTKHYKVYAPDLGYTTKASVVEFDENENASSVDLRLRRGQEQGTRGDLPERNSKEPANPPVPRVELPTPELLNNFDIVIPAPAAPATPLPDPSPADPIHSNSAPDDDVTMDMSPAEPTGHQGRYQLRKRKAELDIDDFEPQERRSKMVRAMFEHGYFTLDEIESAFLTKSSSTDITIPKTYKQAIEDPEHGPGWRTAIQEELMSLEQNGTWREEVPPPGANLVSAKWVFTIKTHADGTLERFKARLVARGFSQEQGVDYFDTFAPTVRMDTLRIFFAMVAANDLECHHLDIKNAFTESIMQERIYLSPPRGVPVTNGYALRVLRSLYGLKQSARDWNQLAKAYFLSLGFRQSLADPCLFVHDKKNITLLIYVDDIAVAAPKVSEIQWFHSRMLDRFRTKDLGEISKILSIRITRDRRHKTIYLDQEQYLQTVLKRFGFQLLREYRHHYIPLGSYDAIRPAEPSDTRADRKLYQQGIGSVMYAMVHTRPDIAFALGKLSQHMSDPADFHWKAFKGLLRYLASTISTRMRYGPGPHRDLVLYSDADWAAQKSDRKSTSGSVSFLYGGPICWGSRVQRSVATSSTESEYIAMSNTAKMSQWIAQVLRDMNQEKYIGKDPNTVEIKGDNQGSLALVQNPHLHERSKHIDICYHHVRDLEERKKINVAYVPTENMPADGLTKPLQRTAFERFISQLGLSDWNLPRYKSSKQ